MDKPLPNHEEGVVSSTTNDENKDGAPNSPMDSSQENEDHDQIPLPDTSQRITIDEIYDLLKPKNETASKAEDNSSFVEKLCQDWAEELSPQQNDLVASESAQEAYPPSGQGGEGSVSSQPLTGSLATPGHNLVGGSSSAVNLGGGNPSGSFELGSSSAGESSTFPELNGFIANGSLAPRTQPTGLPSASGANATNLIASNAQRLDAHSTNENLSLSPAAQDAAAAASNELPLDVPTSSKRRRGLVESGNTAERLNPPPHPSSASLAQSREAHAASATHEHSREGNPRNKHGRGGVSSSESELASSDLEVYQPAPPGAWTWLDPEVYGSSHGTKYYTGCSRLLFDGTRETIKLGDAVRLVSGTSDEYNGIAGQLTSVLSLDQTEELKKNIHVIWFYKLADLSKEESKILRQELKAQGLDQDAALLISQHPTENELITVHKRITVRTVGEVLASQDTRPLLSDSEDEEEHDYYLAGVYDSFNKSVTPMLRGDFSLPKMLQYESLERQALEGKTLELPPRSMPKDWIQ